MSDRRPLGYHHSKRNFILFHNCIEAIAMTNINTQLGISCLTAVVSSVQSKNIDLFLRQRIALGQLVLTCLPLYLILIEVITNELV